MRHKITIDGDILETDDFHLVTRFTDKKMKGREEVIIVKDTQYEKQDNNLPTWSVLGEPIHLVSSPLLFTY